MKDPGECGNNQDDTSNHGNHLFDLKSSWKHFDNVGSQFLVQLCGSLVGSQYDAVSKDIVALLGPVFACGNSELVLGRFKEIESLMSEKRRHPDTDSSGDSPTNDRQVMGLTQQVQG